MLVLFASVAIAGLVCVLCRAIALFSSNDADYITSTATLHLPLMTMPKRRIYLMTPMIMMMLMTKRILRTMVIPTTKMNARTIPRILPTVSNPFVSCYRNSLIQYLVVFRCRHSSPQQPTPVGSTCC